MCCGESGDSCGGEKNGGSTLWCIKGLVATSELQGHDFKKNS